MTTNTDPKLDEIRNDKGELPAYAWPGGYPIAYLFGDGETCCPACANGDAVDRQDDPDMAWHIVGYFAHYEGPPIECANCHDEIESAYGDPESE